MPPDPNDPNFPVFTLVHDVGPKVTRIPVVQAIKIDDEIIYISRAPAAPDGRPWPKGTPQVWARRGMEGTTPAEHAEGAEIEFITATITPEQAAEAKRYGRFVQRRNGSYPHSWEDPSRQDWPEMNP